MTDRSDLNRLNDAQRELVRLARNELAGFFATVDLSRPELVRDALLEIVPLLVREYGDVAATVAAEWYESVHPDAFLARAAPGVDPGKVQGSVRYAAGGLFGEDPAQTLSILSGAMQRFILYSGRETVARNVQRDPSRPRFARVPSGAKTCAFCNLMASRGFVYYTRETAGLNDEYHDDCDCQIVPEWDRDNAAIEGYDPDTMFDQYQQARDAAGSGDPKKILSAMRELFPDAYTDSHVH